MGKQRELENFGPYVGKYVYLEIKGGVPLVAKRREIAVKAKVVDVDEINVEKKTITIEIPLKNITSLSFSPLRPRGRKRVGLWFKEALEKFKSFNVIEDPEGAAEKLNDGDKIVLGRLRHPSKEELKVIQQILGPDFTKQIINRLLRGIRKNSL